MDTNTQDLGQDITHYVVVMIGQRILPDTGKLSISESRVEVEVRGGIYPIGMVTWIDGSKAARDLAFRSGYPLLEPSVWPVYQKASFSDRAASGGRATRGVMTAKKWESVAKNGAKKRPMVVSRRDRT